MQSTPTTVIPTPTGAIELLAAFNHFDKNSDGFLSRNQFGDLLSYLGFNIGKSRTDELWGMIDSNKDGQISYEDFNLNYEKLLTIVSQLGFTNVGIAPSSTLGTQADLRTAFDTYDINKDGYITRTQFGDLLSFIGINIGKPRTDELWEIVDTDRDGRITYEELDNNYSVIINSAKNVGGFVQKVGGGRDLVSPASSIKLRDLQPLKTAPAIPMSQATTTPSIIQQTTTTVTEPQITSDISVPTVTVTPSHGQPIITVTEVPVTTTTGYIQQPGYTSGSGATGGQQSMSTGLDYGVSQGTYGLMTSAQGIDFKTAFSQVDKNHTGYITREQFGELLRSLGRSVDTGDKLETLWNQLDVNKSGRISYDEFSSNLGVINAA
jgi:Ca2+-binding EF-hand superfamily protein